MTSPEKYALCISKPENIENMSVIDLLTNKPFLVPRSICETDLNTLQVLPYAALVDTANENGPKYFVYTRGAGGGEGRLVGKCSIGIGGHMEEAPENSNSPFLSFADCIAECIVREIEEEVGLSLVFVDFVNAMFPNIYKTIPEHKSSLAANWSSLIYAPLTDVDAVHIAIAFAVKVNSNELLSLEKNVITKGKWLTYEEIQDGVHQQENPIILETWSHILLERLNESWKLSGVDKEFIKVEIK